MVMMVNSSWVLSAKIETFSEMAKFHAMKLCFFEKNLLPLQLNQSEHGK